MLDMAWDIIFLCTSHFLIDSLNRAGLGGKLVEAVLETVLSHFICYVNYLVWSVVWYDPSRFFFLSELCPDLSNTYDNI